MKRVLFLVAVVFAISASVFSQSTNYKAFKVDVGGLYAIPGGDAVKSGIGFYVEPKYNITNNIAVGLRMESAIMAAAASLGDGVSVSAVGSYLLTGDYYFNENYVRPFAGAGLGIYTLGSVEFTAEDAALNNDAKLDLGSKFGFAPRVGVLIGHFRLGLEYNVITGLESGLDSKNYMAIKLGWEIGGGKK